MWHRLYRYNSWQKSSTIDHKLWSPKVTSSGRLPPQKLLQRVPKPMLKQRNWHYHQHFLDFSEESGTNLKTTLFMVHEPWVIAVQEKGVTNMKTSAHYHHLCNSKSFSRRMSKTVQKRMMKTNWMDETLNLHRNISIHRYNVYLDPGELSLEAN